MESEFDSLEQKPDFKVLVSEIFASGFEDDLVVELEAGGARARSFRISVGPFAGVELYLPTAVALFIASSYFGGVFQRIGEDHYETVKRVAQRLYRRIAGVRVTPIGSAGKVSSNRRFSLTYSIVSEITPGLSFKFILLAEIAQSDGERAVVAFLDLIRDIHVGAIDPEALEQLLSHRPIGGVVLVTFDAKSGQIVPVDPTE